MMVKDMYFDIITLAEGGKFADAVGLPYVDQYQPCYFTERYIFDFFRLQQKHGRLHEKVPEILFLSPRKGKHRIRIELFSGDHGSQAVKICIYVGSDNVHYMKSLRFKV